MTYKDETCFNDNLGKICLMQNTTMGETWLFLNFQAIFLKLNPMYLMYPTAIATSFAFMLPVATPPNAVVFSYGYVRVIDMVRWHPQMKDSDLYTYFVYSP